MNPIPPSIRTTHIPFGPTLCQTLSAEHSRREGSTAQPSRRASAHTSLCAQIPDAVNEIRLDGVTEFTPTPAESLQLISGGYKVPRTLLVRFADDPIDESRALQRALLDGGRNPADNALLELAGSHVTPCAPDSAPRPADPSGRVSPADFLAAGASFVLSRETSLLADRVVAFLDDETR